MIMQYPSKDQLSKEEKDGIFRINIELEEGVRLENFGGIEKILFVSGRNLHKLIKRIKKIVPNQEDIAFFSCEYEGNYVEVWVPDPINSNGGCWDDPEL